MSNYRFIVRFEGGLDGNEFLNVACDTWEEVEREIACFGVDNLIYIRENH